MPTKVKCDSAPIGDLRISVLHDIRVVKRWHEDCDRDVKDTTIHYEPPAFERYDSTVIPTASHYIAYGNSGKRRMNNCTHFDKTLGSSDSSWVLSNRWTRHDDYPYEGCGPYDFIHEDTYHSAYIRLAGKYFETQAGGGLGDIASDHYLSGVIGESIWKQKMTQLNSMAREKFLQSDLDDGFSMPVFLIELIELKSLWDTFLKNGSRIFSVTVSALIDLLKSLFDSRGLRKALKDISSDYLATIFGLLPLIGDIKKIAEKFLSVAGKVDSLLENENTILFAHYQKALAPTTFRDDTWFSSPGYLELGDQWKKNTLISALTLKGTYQRSVKGLVFHATAKYKYTLPDYSAGVKSLLAELDHWGLNLSPSDLWELIPFSFVIDWVINIGGWLKQFDAVNLPVQVEILDYCYSLGYEYTQEFNDCTVYRLDSAAGNTDEPGEWTITPANGFDAVRSKSYYRWAGLPEPAATGWVPTLRTPKGKHVLISAALILQRL